ncbi:hypothetical protein SRABI112_04324 [Pseudomonas mediterranea]|jgi:hypothetical protein|uniref:Uncharacterized protein n=1 Tax=Pseudomonas mediterranea TaxID=183795 RepID=A0AAX2D9F8_9PSED|nr:hypothetical protein SRABI112_04324 [Pseudomonas mediterranea]SDU23324.1 hypothetical protein SAMN05216476_1039 [Pseudomonas mediterranea]
MNEICEKDQIAIILLSQHCRLYVIFVQALHSGSNELMLGRMSLFIPPNFG